MVTEGSIPLALNCRARENASSLSEAMLAEGLSPVEVPALEFRKVSLSDNDKQVVESLESSGDLLVFTSANGFRFAKELVELDRFGLAALGAGTASTHDKWQFVGSGVDSETFASEILQYLSEQRGYRRLVLLRGDKASAQLPDHLRSAGWNVTEVSVYGSACPRLNQQEHEALGFFLSADRAAVICLSSSEAAKNLVTLGEHSPNLLKLPVAALGERTAETAREQGFETVKTAKENSVSSLAECAAGLCYAGALGSATP